jgi:hypothetical protein
MAGKEQVSDAVLLALQLGVVRWGLGMIGVGGLVGVVTFSVGGLGNGLVRLIVTSLRAGVAPDAFPVKRLLVVLLAWAAGPTTNWVGESGTYNDSGLDNEKKLDLAVRLSRQHEFADTGRPITAAFAGAPGNSFTVFGSTAASAAAPTTTL